MSEVRAGSIRLSWTVLAVLVGSCVAPQPAPRPAPPPPPVSALPAAPIGEDWRDIALTAGTWSYRNDGAAGSVAQFGQAGQAASFAMRCEAATRQIIVSRAAGTSASAATIGFVTSFGTFGYPGSAPTGQPPAVAARIAATDPNLDRLAFSRGRFLVRLSGATQLVLPSWPEAARVIEDCRG